MAPPLVNCDRPKLKCSVDGCVKEYYSKTNLNLHLQIVHYGNFKKFECSFCSSQFKSKQGLDGHIVSAHTLEKAYQCENCPSRFSTAAVLWSHRLVHTNKRPHKCLTCSKQFKKKSALKQHEVTHISNRPRNYPCSICLKAFFTKRDLKCHSLIHSSNPRDRFVCYFCKKQFHTKGNLVTHTREKPFTCREESCKFSCSNQTYLANHRKIQNSPTEGRPHYKTWSCYFCNKTLLWFSNLVMHIRIHTLESPFFCGLCQKHFKCHKKLTRHISSHTMEKPFRCQKCFTDQYLLKIHVGAVHRGEKRFFCTFCNYSSYQKCDLNAHSRRCKGNIS